MLSTESLIINPSEPLGPLPLHEDASAHVLNDIEERRVAEEKRRVYLKRQLRRYGAMYRDDSRLCQKFIAGDGLPIDEIAIKLKEMDYFVKKTNYCKIMGRLFTAHRSHCKDTDFIASKDYLSPIAKLHVLSKVEDHNSVPVCTDKFCIISRKGFGYASTRCIQNGDFTTPYDCIAFPEPTVPNTKTGGEE